MSSRPKRDTAGKWKASVLNKYGEADAGLREQALPESQWGLRTHDRGAMSNRSKPLAKPTAAARVETTKRREFAAKPFVQTGCSPKTASRLGRNSILDRVSEMNQTRGKRKRSEMDFDEAQAENRRLVL